MSSVLDHRLTVYIGNLDVITTDEVLSKATIMLYRTSSLLAAHDVARGLHWTKSGRSPNPTTGDLLAALGGDTLFAADRERLVIADEVLCRDDEAQQRRLSEPTSRLHAPHLLGRRLRLVLDVLDVPVTDFLAAPDSSTKSPAA